MRGIQVSAFNGFRLPRSRMPWPLAVDEYASLWPGCRSLGHESGTTGFARGAPHGNDDDWTPGHPTQRYCDTEWV